MNNIPYLREATVLLVAFEVDFLTYHFHSKLYKRKYSKKIYILYIVLLTIINYGIEKLRIPVLNTSTLVLSIMLTSFILFEGEIKDKIVNNLYFVLVLLIIDILISAIFSLFHKNIMTYLANDEHFFVSNIVIIILNVVAYEILSNMLVKYKISSIKLYEILFVILIAVFQIIGLIYIAIGEMGTENRSYAIIFFGIGFLVLIGYEMYMNKITILYYEDEKKKNVNRVLQEKHYQYLEEKNKYYRIMEHDIQKHLSTIEELSKSREFKLVDSYINVIKGKIEDIKGPYVYRNRILQVMINEMYQRCQLINIECTINVVDIDLDFIDAYDLTVILGNLIDNACEACLEMNDEKAYIRLRIYEFNDYVMIHLENSFSQHIIKNDQGEIISSKRDDRGIGLKNIIDTIEKYDGVMDINAEESFIVQIIIPKS